MYIRCTRCGGGGQHCCWKYTPCYSRRGEHRCCQHRTAYRRYCAPQAETPSGMFVIICCSIACNMGGVTWLMMLTCEIYVHQMHALRRRWTTLLLEVHTMLLPPRRTPLLPTPHRLLQQRLDRRLRERHGVLQLLTVPFTLRGYQVCAL